MNLMGLQGRHYRPLSQEQVETLHNAALKLLETTGITYETGLEATADLLEANGAAVDRDEKRIRIPAALIETSVAKAPEQVILCGRDSKNDLNLTENRVHMGTGGGTIKILDPDTGEIRSTTLKDLHDVSRLVDQLENVHFLVRPCIPTDIDKKDYDINMFHTCLRASGKHVMSGVNDEQGLHNVKAFTAVLNAMGGSNYIHHAAGMLESMLAVAHEQFVIDDEIIGNACKVLKGIEVDEEHLALDVIDAVGPGGNFMTSPHTLKHIRSEYYNSNGVTDRKSLEKWAAEGSWTPGWPI